MHGPTSLIPYTPSRPTPEQHKTRQTLTSCYSIDPAIIKSTAFHIILNISYTRFSYLHTSWKTSGAVIIMCYQWQSVPCWQIRKRSIHSIHLFYVNNGVLLKNAQAYYYTKICRNINENRIFPRISPIIITYVCKTQWVQRITFPLFPEPLQQYQKYLR